MPNRAGDIRFVPVTEEHYDLLRRWLGAPHWRQWWGDPETEHGYIKDMVEGRDTTRPFIFMIDGVAAGYIQYWFIGHHQNEAWIKDNPWLEDLPADAVGVDLSIGEVARLSKGIGSAVLAAFVAKLRGESYQTIVIDPDPENMRAIRAYEKAGFRPIASLQGRTPGVHLMQHHIPTAEIAQ